MGIFWILFDSYDGIWTHDETNSTDSKSAALDLTWHYIALWLLDDFVFHHHINLCFRGYINRIKQNLYLKKFLRFKVDE